MSAAVAGPYGLCDSCGRRMCNCGTAPHRMVRADLATVHCPTHASLFVVRDGCADCGGGLVARLARKAARLFADHTGRLVTIGGAR